MNERSKILYLYIGQAFSLLGDWCSAIVFPLMLYKITENTIAVAILMLCRFVPNIISPLILNKINKNNLLIDIMIKSDIFRAIFFILFIFANKPIHFYVLTFIIYTGNSLFNPCKYTIIPDIVKEDNIEKSTNIIMGIENIFMLIGPIIGSLIYAYIGANLVIMLNSATYIISCLLLYKLKKLNDFKLNIETNKNTEKFINIIKKAIKIKSVVYLIYAEALGCLAFGTLNFLLPVMTEQSNIYDDKSYGYLVSALALGLIIGNFFMGAFYKQKKYEFMYLVSTIVAGLSFICLGVYKGLIINIINIICIGIGNSIQDLCLNVFIQNTCKEEQERITMISFNQSLISMSIGITTIVTPIFISKFNIYSVIIVLGTIPLSVSLCLLLKKVFNQKNYIEA